MASRGESSGAPRALPREFPIAAGGGWGAGRPCVVCDEPIGRNQAEVEASFAPPAPHTFHARCFVQWWQAVSMESASAARV